MGEAEKMELEAALSEAEGALEQEENKVLRAQLELTQVRQEIERRMAEKDEEFESTRKNFGKAIEGMQAAIEVETKAKAEALRMKKKLETDVVDLDTSLEHANAANSETQKTIKKYHFSIRGAQAKLEEEQHAKEAAHDHLIAADRKAHANQNALEEARTLLEQADRARRIVEQELSDTNETLGELTCANQAISGGKRKLRLWNRLASFWKPRPRTCKPALMIPSRTLSREERRPWANSRVASGSLNPNSMPRTDVLEMPRRT